MARQKGAEGYTGPYYYLAMRGRKIAIVATWLFEGGSYTYLAITGGRYSYPVNWLTGGG